VTADRGWKRAFDELIPLRSGRQLVTLEDAARYIQKLAKAKQQLAEWQIAVEAMLLVVEHMLVTDLSQKRWRGSCRVSGVDELTKNKGKQKALR
jgi:hypothetical protein